MDGILVKKTKLFIKDIDKIPKQIDINTKIEAFISKSKNKTTFLRQRNALCIYNGSILKDIEYQIYSYRITQKYRLIFSYDEDELFNETTITLYGIISPEELGTRISRITNAIKQDFGVS